MNTVRNYFYLFILGLIVWSSISATTNTTHTIEVKITNVRNSKGVIQMQVYRDQPTFKAETPWKIYYVPKDNLKDKTILYKLTGIPAGTYGIAILDDENKNTKMDYSFMIPQEGFGFSNYFLSKLAKPKFDDFKFQLNGDMCVTIKTKYV